MNFSETKIKELLVERLSELSESIILRKEPYESIEYYPQVTSYLTIKYLDYKDELDDDLRKKIISRDIDFAKYLIRTSIMGFRGRPFTEQYPEHKNTAAKFEDWIRKKEGYKNSVAYSRLKRETGKKVDKIIRNLTLERRTEFSYDKAFHGTGLIPFSSTLTKNNKILMVFDKGSKRSFFDLFIGLEGPEFRCDIANFFGRSQSNFYYSNDEEVKKQVNIALDIIDILLPDFVEVVAGCLGTS